MSIESAGSHRTNWFAVVNERIRPEPVINSNSWTVESFVAVVVGLGGCRVMSVELNICLAKDFDRTRLCADRHQL